MTIAYYDNPARRLLNILNKAKEASGNISSHSAWKEVLDLPDNSTDTDILLAVGKVTGLVAEINNYCAANEPEHLEDCQYWMNSVLRALACSSDLGSTWGNVLSVLNGEGHTFSYLRNTARIIDFNINKEQVVCLANINKNDLLEINDSVKSLYSEILSNEEIDEKVKASILKYLSKLIDAIDQYAITGAEAILESLEQTIGHMYFNPEYKRYMAETDSGKNILSKMGEIAKKVTCVTGVVELLNKSVDVVEKIQKIIE